MSRMGMLKTAISGRFGHIVGEGPSDNIDVGAKKPEEPKTPKREKKEKRTKGDAPEVKGPAIYAKPGKQELKHGHDPNKTAMAQFSSKKIIVEPSQRHLGYLPSTRNIFVEPERPNLQHKSSMRNVGMSTIQNNKISMRVINNNNSLDQKTSLRNMNMTMNGLDMKSLRNMGMDSIDETNSTAPMSTIDENSSRNNNLNNTDSSNSTSKSSSSVNSKAPTSSKSPLTASAKSTNSASTKSAGITDSNLNKSNHSNDNRSNHSNDNRSNNSNDNRSTHSNKSNSTHDMSLNKSNHSNNGNSNHNTMMNNRSSHSLSSRTESTNNVSNKTAKNRSKPPRKRGPSLVTPAHFNRDRPSTVLITRKELEEILAEKVKEEMLEKKTLPPKSGTLSTDLWVANAQKEPQSEEFSVASGTSVDEDDPFARSNENPADVDDEYDINFSIPEEETITEHTEHTIHSDHDHDHNSSFSMEELNLQESMNERRCTTIRFDEYDELQTCLHINDYTKGEISKAWYRREDYDKMVDLARKTATKAVKREKELREELETMLSPPKAGRKNGERREENGGDDNKSVGSGISRGPDGKRKKPIEYRGLEAWTPEGSAKCRSLKENAIELVWNEQSRQWEDGEFDPEAIAEIYTPVAAIALKAAHERALADEKMVKKLIDQEEARAEKKRNRTVLLKAKSGIKKQFKNSGKGIVHVGGKVVTETAKGATKIGKRGVRATVAAATLDPKMMKEALKIRVHGRKKREVRHQNIEAQSKAAHERDIEEMEESGSLSLQDSTSNSLNPLDRRQALAMQKPGLQRPALAPTPEIREIPADNVSDDLSSMNDGGPVSNLDASSYDSDSNFTSPQKKKKSKLKLLGVVPIPGTSKKYSEDRRQDRIEKRKAGMTRRPSWEASMTTGKF